MIIEPIGIIHTPFEKKEDCPIQPVYAPDAIGCVEVFERYSPGLKDGQPVKNGVRNRREGNEYIIDKFAGSQ